MIHLALAGETLPIYGDGRQRRDYIYVDDVGRRAPGAGSRVGPSAAGRVYNVGTGVGTPHGRHGAGDHRASPAAAASSSCRGRALAEQIETGDFVADISRIRRELGWRPRVSLDDGLRRTVAFYRAHVPS